MIPPLANLAPTLVEVILKGVLVAALALLLTQAIRHASAAKRHKLLRLALLSLLILPLFSVWLPDRQIDVPGTVANWIPNQLEVGPDGSADAFRSPIVFLSNDVTSKTASRSTTLASWLIGLWGLGVVVLLLRLLVGLARVVLLTRRARSLSELRWWRLHVELLSLLGITRPVGLLMSPSVTAPMTWGLWRPVVLLPAEAESWSDERRRLVLTHELAHVARQDWFWQLLAAFAVALHWVNPFAHLVAQHLRLESEKASDDVVLRMGTQPSSYAELLLDFTRRLVVETEPQPALSTAMLRSSQLGARIVSILSSNRNRSPGSRRFTLLAGVLILAGIGLLATLQFNPQVPIDLDSVQRGVPWWQLASGESTQLSCGQTFGLDEPGVECGIVALRTGVPGLYLLTVTPALDERIPKGTIAVPDVATWVELMMLEL